MRTNDFYNIIELVKRDVLDSEREYLKLLKVIGNNQRYDFLSQLSIYDKNPNATACASFDMWRERFNRTVMRGQKGIPILNDSNAFQKVGYIFDISQTVSMDRNVNEVELWSFDREKHENALKDKVQIQQEFNTYKQKIDEFNKLIKTVVENERGQGRYNSAIGGRYTANIDSLPNGLYQIPFVMMYSENGLGETSGGYSTIYKQAYSIVYGREHKFFSQDFTSDGNYRIEKNTGGEKTIVLPSEGLATYNGKAFTANHDGELTYTVNFTDRTGSGKLSNFKDIDDISLNSGEISSGSNMIKSSASMANGTQGEYELSFYGPNAEEIAGKAYIYKQLDNTKHVNGGTAREYNQKDERGELIRGTQFGFGGTRGEIQK